MHKVRLPQCDHICIFFLPKLLRFGETTPPVLNVANLYSRGGVQTHPNVHSCTTYPYKIALKLTTTIANHHTIYCTLMYHLYTFLLPSQYTKPSGVETNTKAILKHNTKCTKITLMSNMVFSRNLQALQESFLAFLTALFHLLP